MQVFHTGEPIAIIIINDTYLLHSLIVHGCSRHGSKQSGGKIPPQPWDIFDLCGLSFTSFLLGSGL
jgi:hypothetical protein